MILRPGTRVVLTRIPYDTATAALRLALYDSGEVIEVNDDEAFVMFDQANTFGGLWVKQSWLARDHR